VVGGAGSCTAVVCEDDQVLAAALAAVLLAEGVRVVAWVQRGSDLAAAVRRHDPAVMVVDAALLGVAGAGLLVELRAVSRAKLVALCPPGLDLRGLTGDADVLVPGDDLGPLRQMLAALVAAACAGDIAVPG